MSIIEQIIRNNANHGVLMTPQAFKKLSRGTGKLREFERPYFFFAREVEFAGVKDEKEYQDIKNRLIRHLVPYNNRYYDYIANKEFATLVEWAKYNGWTLPDIRYGVVKKHRDYVYDPVIAYVDLDTLLEHLDPTYGETDTAEIPEMSDKQKLIAQIEALLETVKKMA